MLFLCAPLPDGCIVFLAPSSSLVDATDQCSVPLKTAEANALHTRISVTFPLVQNNTDWPPLSGWLALAAVMPPTSLIWKLHYACGKLRLPAL